MEEARRKSKSKPEAAEEAKAAESSQLYQVMGGKTACLRLSEAFYARVAKDPLLRPLFPSTFRCAIEAFAAFLVQFLDGPPEDAQRRYHLSLRESHQRFMIGRKERDAWMACMAKALDDVETAEPLRRDWVGLFDQASAYLVNQGPQAEPRECRRSGLTRRWDMQLALDKGVAAVRAGKTDRAIALASGLRSNRSVFAGLLGLMCGDANLRNYVEEQLHRDPTLAHERCGGRTLLHAAAAAGDITIVELLLQFGADPNIRTSGDRTPLYCLANECRVPAGAAVVRALVRAGAGVNACVGVKQCTALHMAARRGNVEVAEALLDCGAAIDARDSKGDTPLQRAVNCRRSDVAALLRSRRAFARP